jgi:HK97 family phage portal protein
VGWLTGSERKNIGLQVPDGTQNVITIPAFAGGQPNADGALYPDASYQSSASSGYGRNELVYACIRERAENLPQSVLRVYPGDQPAATGEPMETHRLRRLIAQPNPVCGEFEFFELSVTYLDLAGNCYWLIQRGRDGLPAELWPVRPDLVRIFPTTNPRVWNYGYILDPSTAARNITSEIIPISRRDIIHVKYPNPLDAYFGQAPLRPASRATSLDNAATDFVDTLLRNYAVPGVVIETAAAINQSVVDVLKRRWRLAFGGDRKGDPAFLQAGMKVTPLGMNLRDLEFPDLRAYSESRICAALDVPPILVGAKVGLDRSTFTNYGEARKQLWEEAIFSLQRRFRDPVESQLLPEFTGVGRARVHTRWDNSDVLALQEAESAKWERATNALARGGIMINDFRRTVGLDPVPGGDVFLMPAGVTATPADKVATPPPAPAPAVPAPDAVPPDAGQQPPQLQAASYADRFLKELAYVNGAGRDNPFGGKAWDPNQPRDPNGEWAHGGGTSGSWLDRWKAAASGANGPRVKVIRGIYLGDDDPAKLAAVRKDPAAFIRTAEVGRHWSASPDVARQYAMGSDEDQRPGRFGVILHGEVNHTGILPPGDPEIDAGVWQGANSAEQEYPLRQGAAVNVTSITVAWRDAQGNPHTETHSVKMTVKGASYADRFLKELAHVNGHG